MSLDTTIQEMIRQAAELAAQLAVEKVKQEQEPLIDAEEVAKLLGCSTGHIYSLVKSNQLQAYRIGKLIKFRYSEVCRSLKVKNEKPN